MPGNCRLSYVLVFGTPQLKNCWLEQQLCIRPWIKAWIQTPFSPPVFFFAAKTSPQGCAALSNWGSRTRQWPNPLSSTQLVWYQLEGSTKGQFCVSTAHMLWNIHCYWNQNRPLLQVSCSPQLQLTPRHQTTNVPGFILLWESWCSWILTISNRCFSQP